MKTVIIAALLCLATIPAAAQTREWVFDKHVLFGPDALGIDIRFAELDGNPATSEWIAAAFDGYFAGQYRVIIERSGVICMGHWFSVRDLSNFTWSRLETHAGLTKLVVQASPAETITVYRFDLPSCAPGH
jgi:hypothetical protein